MEDRKFPRRFIDALRPGAYLRIIVEGNVGAGDEIRVIGKPLHDLTIREFFRIYYSADRDELQRLVAIPGISESWREWADGLLQKAESGHASAAAPTCR
jgi:MOSC domain-containing protein YiiM